MCRRHFSFKCPCFRPIILSDSYLPSDKCAVFKYTLTFSSHVFKECHYMIFNFTRFIITDHIHLGLQRCNNEICQNTIVKKPLKLLLIPTAGISKCVHINGLVTHKIDTKGPMQKIKNLTTNTSNCKSLVQISLADLETHIHSRSTSISKHVIYTRKPIIWFALFVESSNWES